ncbi:hypothetical protein AGMMS50262_17530 [Bacteroidia bacterium]|nr:hypothetical protein AGMMS50262_17530 [Bacteroidia bacterium]
MMETKLTEQESLAVINEMIDRARNNFRKGSGNSMIYWGCWCAFSALLVFILLKTLSNPTQAFWAWWLMALAGVIDFFIQRKKKKEILVRTQIDNIIDSVWRSYLFFCCLFLGIIFAFGIVLNDGYIFWLITPVILSAVGMGEFITAKAYRFKWYLYGAIVMWTGAALCVAITLWTTHSVFFQFLILAACMLLGFVLPGYLLNKKSDSHV